MRISSLAQLSRSPDGVVSNDVRSADLAGKQILRITAVGAGRLKRIDPKLRTQAFYGSA